MPQIDLVPNMKKAPGKCVCCNTTPTDPHTGNPKPAIDLNVDVDWGNNAYLCEECVNVICDLWGRVDEDTHDRLRKDYEDLRNRHTRLQKRYTTKEEDLKKVEAGKSVERKRRKRKAA